MKKLIGRLSELMNYMTFVDLSGQCPANSIVIDCNSVKQLRPGRGVKDLANELMKLSRYYNHKCNSYDFISQYVSKWLATN